MTVKELVWDMDGTLLDTTPVVPAALARAVRALGGPGVDADDIVAEYWRGTPEVIMEHLVGRPLMVTETEVYYRELEGAEGAPYPGVVDVFAALRAQGRALAVFTGASSRAAGMLLRSAGLHVDVLIGGDHVSRPKPAPDGVLLAAKELGIDPVDIAYVGDSPLDLRAAVGAGSRGAAAAWGHLYDQAERADVVLSGSSAGT
ncbi:HAD family hydrolase [Streptomyces aurantiogriseus]|uniref:Phosphoglycolate phosphatase 2 n=1 Tax=Streptomyces aurantiogriseus TaxID=66870 RepID=A0A918KXF7_9ACTN|nr:HAD family hydrolase [Streptomyces aurantiogriseus]GGR40239.1 phosphoglycolate phosphatase 2 [Streptomyces aurantiogriseus]